MFDQYDPGFLPGLIGVIIGYTFRVVLQRITIVCSFPKQLESLQDHVTYHEKQKFPRSDNWAFVRLDELLRNASEMVENGRNVPWFHVFSRYRMSKNMTKLISDIETHLKFWVAFNPICLAQPVEKMPVEEHVGSALRVATKEKMVAPLDAAVEMTTVLNQKSTLSVSSALRAKEEMSEAAEKSRAAAGTPFLGLSRNGGLSYRLISIAIKMILELNNIELTRKEQLTSLKAVVQELRKQLSSPRYNNGSAICRWLERFDRLLDNAYEMVERIKEARPDIFYRYRRGRKINRLLSEINAHLQLLPLAALGLIEESPHSMVSHSTTNPAQESLVIRLC